MVFRRWSGVAGLVLGVGCGPAIDLGEDGGTSGDGTDGSDVGTSTVSTSVGTSAGTSPGTTIGTTDGPMPTTTAMPTSEVTTDVSISVSASTTVTVTGETDSDTGGTLPNGEMCDDGEQCVSGHCYVVGPLGGVCGECVLDEDCASGGCSLPNPLAVPPQGSVCSGGVYGGGCMTDEACQDPYVCATVLSIPGVLEVTTCGGCLTDDDCADGTVCAPDIAISNVTGVNRCVTLGTLADGQSCDLASATGDAACASGHCAAADLLGVAEIGVCSSCETDEDCNGTACAPPQIDLRGGLLLPAVCE